MDPSQYDRDINGDCSVPEDAFWHSNMDLYYGYDRNELVEVEHEPSKYWLARIVYNYKQLLLLRWECDYGEFWLDTSSNSRRRCYPPGHYLQPLLKSQFEFTRPPKPPTRKDPYANIKNVQDLLSAEEPLDQSDATKCKNITFKPEDAKELEAALQALNELNCDSILMDCDEKISGDDQFNPSQENNQLKTEPNSMDTNDPSYLNSHPSEIISKDVKVPEEDELEKETRIDEEKLHACKTIRHKAIEELKSKIALKIIIPKPRQFYDLGGVSPERLFVPGALVEVCHHIYMSSSKCKQFNDVEKNASNEYHALSHWFAVITENVGGRLTLRWLLSDDPKFKQGRLEIKSIGCSYVDEETTNASTLEEADQVKKIHVKEVSFRLHYCHPSISTIGHGQSIGRSYSLPDYLESSIQNTLEQPQFSYLLQQVDTRDVTTALGELVKAKSKRLVEQIKKRIQDAVFDTRRTNLDKDRPMIDYILHIIKKRCPSYIDASLLQEVEKEVLVSTPKTTKILPGVVKHIFEPGVFLVETLIKSCNGENKVFFIYPYDSSYTLLPKSWGAQFNDCLSSNNLDDPNEDTLKNSPPSTIIPDEKLGTESSEIPSAVGDKDHSEKINNDLETPLKNYAEEINDLKNDLIIDQLNHFGESHETTIETLKINEANLEMIKKFNTSDQLEVVHPSSDAKIISGRIRRISPPLLWIQISHDSYTVLPFNSTDIFPLHFCERYNHPLIYKLPINIGSFDKSNKKNDELKNSETDELWVNQNPACLDSNEAFNIDKISDKQDDINDLITESAWCARIFFNHKCFSGPALSKGKICSLPQYVGPGPVRLVMEEVVTKVISVAYVPPRILNDLSSKNFEDLLISRNIINTSPLTFKAKYQKRVYREELPVIINAEDVENFCECICEHLKCCYNLFGPNLYDGDDCPGHCRGLTKSNKFMKRAIYYREKARLGEFVSDASKKNARNSDATKSRQNYAGRASQESTGSRCKTPKSIEVTDSHETFNATQKDTTFHDKTPCQDILKPSQVISDESECAEINPEDLNLTLSPLSSSDQENHINTQHSDQCDINEIKRDEKSVAQTDTSLETNGNLAKRKRSSSNSEDCLTLNGVDSALMPHENQKSDKIRKLSADVDHKETFEENSYVMEDNCSSNNNQRVEPDMDGINEQIFSEIVQWSVDDVYNFVKDSKYSQFATLLREQEVDGPAFLLLDTTTLLEHLVCPIHSSYSNKEIRGLSELIQDVSKRAYSSVKLGDL